MLYREKHANEGKARGLEKSPQGQVFVEAHHEEVQGRELLDKETSSGTQDLIGTKKLENCNPQVTTGPVLWRGATRTSRSSRRKALQISSRKTSE